MSFGFGVSDFEYVFDVVFRIRNFINSVKDAPKDFDALRAEADCLKVCLQVITYRECRMILKRVNAEQAQDLKTIIYGCQANMEELVGFVASCQEIAVRNSRWDFGPKSLTQIFKAMGKRLWTKFLFVWKEKQPMREKLAIPTQSLNIYLTSLTFVSLSYNTRLSSGPKGGPNLPPRFAKDWDLVGNKVAFKNGDFSNDELLRPGIEDEIVEAASSIIHGTTRTEGLVPTSIKAPRRRSSFGGKTRPGSDRMFLVRPKKSTKNLRSNEVKPTLEIVKADHEFGSDSGSDLAFDDDYLSPHGPHSPPRHSDRDYEIRSPHEESSVRHRSAKKSSESKAAESEDEDDEAEERELREVEEKAYKKARVGIKHDRKEAIRKMTKVVAEDNEKKLRDRTRVRFAPADDEPDVRTYMEVAYGVIMDYAPPEIESTIRATQSHESPSAHRAEMSKKTREFETKSKIPESIIDSEVSDDPDSEPEIVIKPLSGRHGREHKYKEEVHYKLKEEERKTLFTIPPREYIPRTEGFEGRKTSVDDQAREHSFRERETSLREREASLREREMYLRERERMFRERKHSRGYDDLPYMHGAGGGQPPIIIEEPREHFERSRPNHRKEDLDSLLNPEGRHRSRERRASYSGSEHPSIIPIDDDEIASIYEESRGERRRKGRGHDMGIRHDSDIRPRNSSHSDDEDDDHEEMYIVRPRKK